MAQQFALFQLYVDAAYIYEDLKSLGITPWFGPTELRRPINNLKIDGKQGAVRRVIFYDAIDPKSPTYKEHAEYLDKLGRLDDTLIRLGTVIGSSNKRQKGVDMKMGRDMIVAAQSSHIEYFALASGDADFLPAVQQVQDMGPKVIVLAFKRSLSVDLAREADRVIYLPDNSDRNWRIQ